MPLRQRPTGSEGAREPRRERPYGSTSCAGLVRNAKGLCTLRERRGTQSGARPPPPPLRVLRSRERTSGGGPPQQPRPAVWSPQPPAGDPLPPATPHPTRRHTRDHRAKEGQGASCRASPLPAQSLGPARAGHGAVLPPLTSSATPAPFRRLRTGLPGGPARKDPAPRPLASADPQKARQRPSLPSGRQQHPSNTLPAPAPPGEATPAPVLREPPRLPSAPHPPQRRHCRAGHPPHPLTPSCPRLSPAGPPSAVWLP
jgi:hypothetical protein